MRYLFSTRELVAFLSRSETPCSPHSLFEPLSRLPLSEPLTPPLTEENGLTAEGRLLERFLLDPDRVFLLGRQAAADGTIYALRKEGLFCLYTYLRRQDFHVFFLYLDVKRLADALPGLLYSFYTPDLYVSTSLACMLTLPEYAALQLCCMVLNLRPTPLSALEPITLDQLRGENLSLYLSNFLEEAGRREGAARVCELQAGPALETALTGLLEKGLLLPLAGDSHQISYLPSPLFIDWLDQGLTLDTVYCRESVSGRERLFALRRPGITQIAPDGESVTLCSVSAPDWEKILSE